MDAMCVGDLYLELWRFAQDCPIKQWFSVHHNLNVGWFKVWLFFDSEQEFPESAFPASPVAVEILNPDSEEILRFEKNRFVPDRNGRYLFWRGDIEFGDILKWSVVFADGELEAVHINAVGVFEREKSRGAVE